MAYKLAIADIVGVKVESTMQDEDGAVKPYSITLKCKRLRDAELAKAMKDHEESVLKFFERVCVDWKQTLVVDADDNPAAYSVDALHELFSIRLMGPLCWQAYLAQVGATAKN